MATTNTLGTLFDGSRPISPAAVIVDVNTTTDLGAMRDIENNDIGNVQQQYLTSAQITALGSGGTGDVLVIPVKNGAQFIALKQNG